MKFSHMDETLFEDGISFATASNKQQAYHITLVMKELAETIDKLTAENEQLQYLVDAHERNAEFLAEKPLSATAFTYDDQETGESIPVPFSELIRHHKQLTAELEEARNEIDHLQKVIQDSKAYEVMLTYGTR